MFMTYYATICGRVLKSAASVIYKKRKEPKTVDFMLYLSPLSSLLKHHSVPLRGSSPPKVVLFLKNYIFSDIHF